MLLAFNPPKKRGFPLESIRSIRILIKLLMKCHALAMQQNVGITKYVFIIIIIIHTFPYSYFH